MGAGIYDEPYDESYAEDDGIDEDETAFDFGEIALQEAICDNNAVTDVVDVTPTTSAAIAISAMSTSMCSAPAVTEVPQVSDTNVVHTSACNAHTHIDGVPGVTAEYVDGTVELAEETTNVIFDAAPVKTRPETEGIAYPCVWLRADTMPGYVAQALQALLSGGTYDDDVNIYPVYAEVADAGVSLQLGYIDSRALRNLLSKPLFATFEKCIKLNADVKNDVSGDMMYAMCTCQSFA